MSKIYEMFGYPVTDKGSQAQISRQRAFCPFMSAECDGGGNRFQSEINLSAHLELKKFFPGKEKIPSGVCSLQLHDNTPPWIICPRRLFYMGKEATPEILNGETQKALLSKCNFHAGARIGVWTEVKIKYVSNDDQPLTFDYTFDYVLVPLATVNKRQAVEATQMPWKQLKRILIENNYVVADNDSENLIRDFPFGSPRIIEVMTSSTSGGNKKTRSTIPQAFEDCMLERSHIAPGINYRQVWARMASQLIVKSQAAIAWGGKAIWILQDLLADYISSSTALNLKNFVSETINEINILSFEYSEKYKNSSAGKTVSLNNSALYAGSIHPTDDNQVRPCFQDIILASVCPPRHVLVLALCKKARANIF